MLAEARGPVLELDVLPLVRRASRRPFDRAGVGEALADELQVLDVRSDDEWQEGYVPGAIHRFAPELKESIDGLDPDKPTVTYCATGYRANAAASLLKTKGFDDVHSVPGSWTAWTAAGFAVEKPEGVTAK